MPNTTPIPSSQTTHTAAVTSYDEIPYDSHPFAQTHPSRLAIVATLFGLTPPPIEKCRVLDIGCAAGGNLTPLAEIFPNSSFVGIDLSARQISDGVQIIQNAGLKNVELRQMNILDINASLGTFDYIICHGVFSWVPDRVRQKILSVCSTNLNPTGVAYVSYNTYPGWHLMGTFREMTRFHAGRFETAHEKLNQARALLDILAQSTNEDTSPYGTLLRQELERLRPQSDSYLYHEYLEGVNDPFYFHQFIEMAHTHGIRYLGEVRLQTMLKPNFSQDVWKYIEAIATDQVQFEQYLDFMRNRPFRETLLVPLATDPNWTIRPEALRKLHISLLKRPSDAAVDVKSSTVSVQYTTTTGMTLTTKSPVLKAAMMVLGQRWPGTVSFADLDQAIPELLEMKSDDGQQLAVVLLNTYLSSDLIEFYTTPVPYVMAKERPIALGVARASINAGQSGVATRRHELLRTNELDRWIIPMLDGTHDRASILDKLVQLSLEGQLHVHKSGQRLFDRTALQAALTQAVETALVRYANICLLKE